MTDYIYTKREALEDLNTVLFDEVSEGNLTDQQAHFILEAMKTQMDAEYHLCTFSGSFEEGDGTGCELCKDHVA